MKSKQDGFTLVETLLTILVIAFISFAGWYVWDSKKTEEVSPAASSVSKVKESKKQTVKEDISSNWKRVSTDNNAFSIKIPDGWKINNVDGEDMIKSDTNSANLIYKKGVPAIIENKPHLGTDAPLRYSLFLSTDNQQGFTDSNATETAFTTSSGIKGVRYYQIYGAPSGYGIGPVEGEKAYEYFLGENGKYYHAAYRILPGDSDNLTAVEESLKTLIAN